MRRARGLRSRSAAGQSLPRSAFAILAVTACLGPFCASARAADVPLAANATAPSTVPQSGEGSGAVAAVLSRIKIPAGFRIELFALVPGARVLAVAPGGHAVVVGTSDKDVYVLKLGTPSGPVVSVKTFAPSITKRMAHGVCFAPDGTLYLAEQNRVLAFRDAARDAESPNLVAHVIVPQGGLIPPARESLYHSMRVCRVGPDGRLYVTIGQPHNVSSPDENAAFAKLGMGAIIRMDPQGGNREIFASGLRNSVGLDFSPADGTLWFTDNQADHMGDDIPPGEINRATKPGQNFGFPWYGGGHVRTREWAASTPPGGLVFPEVETVAHAADLGMTFYRGPAFPEAYRHGIFSAQHGSWDRSVSVGARVIFTEVGPDGHATGRSEPFAEGWRNPDGTYAGRPVDVAELADGSLLVTDDFVGAVYRVSYDGGAQPQVQPDGTAATAP